MTKSSGRNFTETYGRNVTSPLLLTMHMITSEPKAGPHEAQAQATAGAGATQTMLHQPVANNNLQT